MSDRLIDGFIDIDQKNKKLILYYFSFYYYHHIT
jgi:hypothetical protein